MPKLKIKDGLILLDALEDKKKKFNSWERSFHKDIREVCLDNRIAWLSKKQSEKLEELYRKYN